ncbi:MAG: hypothetical protein H0W62_12395 [Chitinophagales bacterium]|nr:hypothetical protein [Chitinophagales bacterium]
MAGKLRYQKFTFNVFLQLPLLVHIHSIGVKLQGGLFLQLPLLAQIHSFGVKF